MVRNNICTYINLFIILICLHLPFKLSLPLCLEYLVCYEVNNVSTKIHLRFQIGLFTTRPTAWVEALAIYTVDAVEGYIVTNISLGEGGLPGDWPTGQGHRGPQCVWPWVGAGDAQIQAFNCLKIQPTWMADNALVIKYMSFSHISTSKE